jgi:hypothetical protein
MVSFMSVLWDYIPEVIPTKKYHIKMGVIISGFREVQDDMNRHKLNK